MKYRTSGLNSADLGSCQMISTISATVATGVERLPLPVLRLASRRPLLADVWRLTETHRGGNARISQRGTRSSSTRRLYISQAYLWLTCLIDAMTSTAETLPSAVTRASHSASSEMPVGASVSLAIGTRFLFLCTEFLVK